MVLKMGDKFPKLKIVTNSLSEGCEIIFYVICLLLLVLYLFAIVGCTFFGANDPWHFANLHTALITLFRSATFDDYTEIMYINILGCDKFDGGDFPMSDCVEPVVSPMLAIAFFVSLSLVANFIFLNALTGVIIVSMGHVVERMEHAEHEANRLKRVSTSTMYSLCNHYALTMHSLCTPYALYCFALCPALHSVLLCILNSYTIIHYPTLSYTTIHFCYPRTPPL
jgi:hypothetical protein